MLRSKREIEEMANRAAIAWDRNANGYNEGVMNTLDWVLRNHDEEPIEEEEIEDDDEDPE